jgi:hypothetical protein
VRWGRSKSTKCHCCDSKPPQKHNFANFWSGGKNKHWDSSLPLGPLRLLLLLLRLVLVLEEKQQSSGCDGLNHGDVVINRVYEIKSANAACNDHCTMLHCCSFDPPVVPRRVWRKWVLRLLLLLLLL